MCSLVYADELQASAFNLAASDGEISLKDYQGKVLYIDFWASWCGPCRQSFPWMEAMQQKYKAVGVEFLAINLDDNREDAESFLKKQNVSFDIAFDPDGVTPKLYKIPGMPSSFIVSRKGVILFSHTGFNLGSIEAYEKHINDAL